jgi:SAM-dependent methyltransferase
MSWDPAWEKIFGSRGWGRYPPEELVRFAARNLFAAADRKHVKVLEVGCGAGANLWFLAREGFDVYGIDGSESAVSKAGRYLAASGFKANLIVGDVIYLNELYPGATFDAVVDVACLQHNQPEAIRSMIGQIHRLLNPAGKIFSMMVARGSYGDGQGMEIAPGTLSAIQEGPLSQVGLVHLSTLEEIQALFGCFSEVRIEYAIRSLDERRHEYKHWVIEGTKSR